MSFIIRFWGVRGSLATPGPETVAVGGNTSQVEVRCGDERLLLDAGTGLRAVGDSLLRQGITRAHILLSHLHWDHIQGLPFFAPAYVPGAEISIWGPAGDGLPLRDALAAQMRSPMFPVRFDELGARIDVHHIKPGVSFRVGDALVRAARLNHPGGSLGYRIEHAGKVLVYATDVEHFACPDPALLRLARGADVLVYDAQYTPEEYRGDAGPSKVGWGHSTFEAGAELAKEAGVGQLVLFHHDPRHDDGDVARIEARARALFPATIAAREGLELTLDAAAEAAA
jgi:phosphoribosyl 1,2-cyclic phosphodiesterase